MITTTFEAPAVVAGLDDIAMVSQAVEQRGGHLGVAEHAGPFAEDEVRGQKDSLKARTMVDTLNSPL